MNTALFELLSGRLPEVLQRRYRFVFEENQRVVAFVAAVVRNDRQAMRELCEGSFFGERDPGAPLRCGVVQRPAAAFSIAFSNTLLEAVAPDTASTMLD